MHPKLEEYLAKTAKHRSPTDPFRTRIESGELRLTFGTEDWPEQWYQNPWVNRSLPYVDQVVWHCPEANDFHVWYFRPQDFHRITFKLAGETYLIEWYKIVSVLRESDQAKFYPGENVGFWFEREAKKKHPAR